jgi:hypothetical protein
MIQEAKMEKRQTELETLSDRELVAYRNICLMSTRMVSDDAKGNQIDLNATQNIMLGRGLPFEYGKLTARKGK